MKIQGKIIDETGQGMPNVHVINGNKGTITDIDGKYTIEARTNDSILFTHVGYAPFRATASDVPAIIKLLPNNTIPEVVLHSKKPFWQTTGFKVGAAVLAVAGLLMKSNNKPGLGYAQVKI